MKKTSVTFYFSNGLTDRLLGNPQCHVCMQAALHASGPGRLGVRSGDVLCCAARPRASATAAKQLEEGPVLAHYIYRKVTEDFCFDDPHAGKWHSIVCIVEVYL